MREGEGCCESVVSIVLIGEAFTKYICKQLITFNCQKMCNYSYRIIHQHDPPPPPHVLNRKKKWPILRILIGRPSMTGGMQIKHPSSQLPDFCFKYLRSKIVHFVIGEKWNWQEQEQLVINPAPPSLMGSNTTRVDCHAGVGFFKGGGKKAQRG